MGLEHRGLRTSRIDRFAVLSAVQGNRGKELLRQRGEKVERGFALPRAGGAEAAAFNLTSGAPRAACHVRPAHDSPLLPSVWPSWPHCRLFRPQHLPVVASLPHMGGRHQRAMDHAR